MNHSRAKEMQTNDKSSQRVRIAVISVSIETRRESYPRCVKYLNFMCRKDRLLRDTRQIAYGKQRRDDANNNSGKARGGW